MSAQAKPIFEKATGANQEASRRLEETYSKATQGAVEYQRKAIAIVQTNVDAFFDCAQELVGVKSASEFMEVSINHACRQLETMAEQSRELASLAQKAATESIEPLTNGLANTFRRSSE
jgi:phasin